MTHARLALAAAVAATGLSVLGAAHAADESNVYVGAGIGSASLSEKGGGVDTGLASQGITSTSDIKKNELNYGLNLGYQFNRNFALEGGWTSLGKHDITGTVSAPAADTLSGSVKAHMFDVAAVGTLPLDGGFGVYGKLGLARTSTKVDVGSGTGATTPADTSENRWGPLYGLGVSYAFNRDVEGTLEYDRVDRLGNDSTTGRFDANLVTAGVRVRF